MQQQPNPAQLAAAARNVAPIAAASYTDLDRTLLGPRFRQEVEDKNRPTHFLSLSKDSATGLVVPAGATVGTSVTVSVDIPIGFELMATTYDDHDADEWALSDITVDNWNGNSSAGKYKGGFVPFKVFDAMLRREMAWTPTGVTGKKVTAANVVVSATIWPRITTTRVFAGFGILGIDHESQCGIRGGLQPSILRLLPQIMGRKSQGNSTFPSVLKRASLALSGAAQQFGGGVRPIP
jgi:hypothetical protein